MKKYRRLAIEKFETRNLCAASDPTAEEQFMLELINRARLDPIGEVQRNVDVSDINQGIPAGTISTDPKPPVAFNLQLIDAARNHNRWMLATGVFSHTGANNSTDEQRAVAAQYAPSGTFSIAENLQFFGTSGTPNVPAFVERDHNELFKSTTGHRQTLMNPLFREIGIAVDVGRFSNLNSVITTHKYATRRDSQFFLTGVVFNDSVKGDRFYTIGEGLGAVSVGVKRLSDGKAFDTSTFGSGGYQVELEAGSYEVQFSGTGIPGTITQLVTIGAQNEKLDLNTANIAVLSLSLDRTTIAENGGLATATVTRQSSDITGALKVTIDSSLTTEATVPATVMIPANQTTGSFLVNAVNDTVADLVQSSLIRVNAPSFSQASATIHVIDDDAPSIWKNPRNAFDVDDNGSIEPWDILIVINRLSRDGIGLLPNTPLSPPLFYDANGDWLATPIDVLNVINAFNRIGASGEAEATTAQSQSEVVPQFDVFSNFDEYDVLGIHRISKQRTRTSSTRI